MNGSWWQTTWFMLVDSMAKHQTTSPALIRVSKPTGTASSGKKSPLMVDSPVSCERLPEVIGSSRLIRSCSGDQHGNLDRRWWYVSIIVMGITSEERQGAKQRCLSRISHRSRACSEHASVFDFSIINFADSLDTCFCTLDSLHVSNFRDTRSWQYFRLH